LPYILTQRLSAAAGGAAGMGERATTGVGIFEMIDREDANVILDRRRGARPPPVTVDELKAFMSADGALQSVLSLCTYTCET